MDDQPKRGRGRPKKFDDDAVILQLRIHKRLHGLLTFAAKVEGVSLNDLMLRELGRWYHRDGGKYGQETEDPDELSARRKSLAALEFSRAAGKVPSRARPILERVLELDPEHVDAHLAMGKLLQDGGKVDEAAVHFQRAAALGDRADAAYALGCSLELLGKIDEATAALNQAVLLDQHHLGAHLALSRIFERIGDTKAALKHLSAARRAQARAGQRAAGEMVEKKPGEK